MKTVFQQLTKNLGQKTHANVMGQYKNLKPGFITIYCYDKEPEQWERLEIEQDHIIILIDGNDVMELKRFFQAIELIDVKRIMEVVNANKYYRMGKFLKWYRDKVNSKIPMKISEYDKIMEKI